jgi:hypothetical protein
MKDDVQLSGEIDKVFPFEHRYIFGEGFFDCSGTLIETSSYFESSDMLYISRRLSR